MAHMSAIVLETRRVASVLVASTIASAAAITSMIAVIEDSAATLKTIQLLDDHHLKESGNLVPIK
jgi:fucose permease